MEKAQMNDKAGTNNVQKEHANSEPMDVTSLMFKEHDYSLASNNSSSTGTENCENFITDEYYSPFFDGSNEEEEDDCSVDENSTLSRIGPFADNRPICDCDLTQRMMSMTDVRYLLSLLPDMAECNAKQKSVFKTRVVTKLQNILLSKV